MKNLSDKGLSMTQAAFVSNLCNQKSLEIEGQISAVNNASKTLNYDGKEYVQQAAKPMPGNIIELILEKGKLSATQAFLMENVREKDRLLEVEKKKRFLPDEAPKYPEQASAELEPLVNEVWAWQQLTANEYAEYLSCQAMAAHIGQFIHKDSKLDKLRKELPNLSQFEWTKQPGTKETSHPVIVTPHHTEEDLYKLHEELAKQHREYEQKVNYYKAKVKNSVSTKNAEITKSNAVKIAEVNEVNKKLMEAYTEAMREYNAENLRKTKEFEAEKLNEIKRISALRILVHPQFKSVVDQFLGSKKDDTSETNEESSTTDTTAEGTPA